MRPDLPYRRIRRLLAFEVVSTKTMHEAAMISAPGTISKSLPQPPAMSGVAPISTMPSPTRTPSTAKPRTINCLLVALNLLTVAADGFGPAEGRAAALGVGPEAAFGVVLGAAFGVGRGVAAAGG